MEDVAQILRNVKSVVLMWVKITRLCQKALQSVQQRGRPFFQDGQTCSTINAINNHRPEVVGHHVSTLFLC